ncbi:MAG: 2-oxoacid:acceptor oxidoreductase family protein [Clostridiales bacterium]|nr:2-oxoacid:acceptor oxidoreductase family protein [Candidatus Crickella merdequi]
MEIIFAGFGGQGVLTSGLITAEMALSAGKNVTWMPAYGPSMRGGKAYSVVKFSDGVIGGPDYDTPDVVVAMNGPSLEFADCLKDGGLLIVNTDAVDTVPDYNGRIDVVEVACTTLAESVKNIKAANIVSIGAIIKARQIFDIEDAKVALKDYFVSHGKGKFAEANEAALMAGFECVK